MTPRYGVLLFDLDGTLTDSGPGIMRGVRHALDRLGASSSEGLEAFVGPPLLESFRVLCGLDEAGAHRAVAAYREYYAERGLFENQVYPGMRELLADLATRPCAVLIATSKPTEYAERILRHFALRSFFLHVVGCSMDEPGIAKERIVARALERVPGWRERGAVMVGDREHDVRAAAYHGVDSIAVGYGYGSDDELREAGPTFRAGSVAELAALLMRVTGGTV
jgi:phosphoglycolate phosphatase